MLTVSSRALAAALLWLPLACTATYRVADAVVTERNGQPCFAPSDDPPVGSLNAVIVYDQSTTPPVSVWIAEIHPDGESKAPDGCIVYGQTFPNAKAAHLPAKALQTGRVYEVDLSVQPFDSTDPTHGYSARFCLVEQSSSAKLRVRQITWDKQAGRWHSEVCGAAQPKE